MLKTLGTHSMIFISGMTKTKYSKKINLFYIREEIKHSNITKLKSLTSTHNRIIKCIENIVIRIHVKLKLIQIFACKNRVYVST